MSDDISACGEVRVDAVELEAIAFVGNALGPLLLEDPAHDAAGNAYAAYASLDVDAAAKEWPFAEEGEAASALRLMRDAIVRAGGAPDDEIVWEYRRLFVGPAAKAAPPWGSVYTDRDCVVFGESTRALRQWMRERGVTRLGGNADPEDHIGLMLMLMAWIADHRPEVLDEYLGDHLLPWSGHFFDEMADVAKHPFYEGLARLASASLEGIREARGIDVVYPRFYR